MARPTKLTRVRHAWIVELLRDGVPFATACREVGVSASAGYEWLYRGWGTHPDRPPTLAYVAFARAVDAVFPGGFAERHEDEDEFAAVTERSKDGQGASFAEPQKRTENGRPASFAEAQSSEGTASREAFAEPQNRCETGGEGFAEVTEPDEIQHQKRSARENRKTTRNLAAHRCRG